MFARQDRAAIKRHFDAMHQRRYGTSAPDERAEIVSLRATVTGVMRKPPQEKIARGKPAPPTRRRSPASGRYISTAGSGATPTYARAALLAGNRIGGPALIEEHASTTVLLPGDRLEVDAYGNLVITVGGRPVKPWQEDDETRQSDRQRKRGVRARPTRSSPRSCATASSR